MRQQQIKQGREKGVWRGSRLEKGERGKGVSECGWWGGGHIDMGERNRNRNREIVIGRGSVSGEQWRISRNGQIGSRPHRPLGAQYNSPVDRDP